MTGIGISNKSKVWKYLNHWMYWKWIFSLLSSFFVSFDITMFAKTSFSFRQMQLLRLYSNSLNETIKENNGRVIVNRKPPTVHYTYKAKTYLYPPLKSCLDISKSIISFEASIKSNFLLFTVKSDWGAEVIARSPLYLPWTV